MAAPLTFAVPFPSNDEVAHAYFSEAARHLQDARTLHDGARPAGSVTSAMKAVELSLKSLLILHSIRGWNDLMTHKVMGGSLMATPFSVACLTRCKANFQPSSEMSKRLNGWFQTGRNLISST